MKSITLPFFPLARAFVATGLAAAALAVHAAPITLSAELTGDDRLSPRYQNLLINVTVTGDTTSNVAQWTVDLSTPAHAKAQLDEFYFSLAGNATDYVFSGFNPAGWTISSPATTVGGGNFSPSFVFEVLDLPGATSVTNAQDLSFVITKTSGNFQASDFLGALQVYSRDTTLGCGQLGAHLQSLTEGKGGFVIGDYALPGQAGAAVSVPEPQTPALVALALLGAALGRRAARRG